MHNPQMALVSKQLVLVLPAQLSKPSVPPLLMFATKLAIQAAVPSAFSVEDPLLSAMQLRKLMGFPMTILTTTKAMRSRESMPVMMKSPRFAPA